MDRTSRSTWWASALSGGNTKWILGAQSALGTGAALPPFPAAGQALTAGEASSSKSGPQATGQMEPGDVAGGAAENSQNDGDRDVTPAGRSGIPLTQSSAVPATPKATASRPTGAEEGAPATRDRRGRPRGSGGGSRAIRTGRGAATSQGRTPRPKGSESPPDPDQRGRNGGESELSREGEGGEGRGAVAGRTGRLRASMSDSQEGATCGGCRSTVVRGQRVVGLPCGHRHVFHARCVVNALWRGGAQAPLFCGARGCTVRHGRREALKAAIQADPGLRATAVGLGGIPNDGEEGRLYGLSAPGIKTRSE